MTKNVTIVGAGLAGSEAAWQLAQQGISVTLYEMRPQVTTKAHKTGLFAELVCSNSFRGAALTNAVGLLKEELRTLNSLIMEAAEVGKVPSGGSLAVDRDVFSQYVTDKLRNHPLITIKEEEVSEIPDASPETPAIIATGPLTSRALSVSIEKLVGAHSLAFFDAISPIILDESLNHEKLFRASRYNKGGSDDYLNIPLDKEQYYAFVEAVKTAERFGGHEEVEADRVEDLRPFEGCMPIEEMVDRGPETLRFGPMKPVGLYDPKTNLRSYAVVQLRQDNKEGTLWSLVGFQTRMKHGEQLRILRTLPGLEEAEFVRLGSVHRNTFLNAPQCLNATLEFRTIPGLFFAGQVTGVEGYVESTAGGMAAAYSVAALLEGREVKPFPANTATGALLHYISDSERKQFQPMNINFGLIAGFAEAIAPRGKDGKDAKRLAVSERALGALREFVERRVLPGS